MERSNKRFCCWGGKSEKENIDSDGSGKRKSSELSWYNKVRVIVPNPELNGGRAEAEKEKNPKQENQEVYEKIDEKDYNQVEDKREI